jgi:hypothetical protein
MLRTAPYVLRLIPGTTSAGLAARAWNRQLTISGHFSAPGQVEDVEAIGQGHHLLRVRRADGSLAETVLIAAELEAALVTAADGEPGGAAQRAYARADAHRAPHRLEEVDLHPLLAAGWRPADRARRALSHQVFDRVPADRLIALAGLGLARFFARRSDPAEDPLERIPMGSSFVGCRRRS